MASALNRPRELLIRERWTLCLALAAFVVRAHWNLVVHPTGDYIYSDMNGYDARANALIDHPWTTGEYEAFFPFGTHWFVALLKLALGRENYVGIGLVYAFLGSLTVALAYIIARRASAHRWVPPAVGLVLVFYYPLISMNGYMLSETPWLTLLLGAQYFILRLMADGRTRDALAAGLCVAIGTVFRPQILLSCALFGLYWIITRGHMPRVKLKALLISAIPIFIILAGSSYRLHRHTGRFGLVSENASLNYMFGRCHAARVQSNPDGKGHGRVHFLPPPYLQLRARDARKPDHWFKLRPALGYEIHYRGYIGDKAIHAEFVRKCLEKTGIIGQLDYAFVNLVLLWHYNVPWPDSGKNQWRGVAKWWQQRAAVVFAIPSLFGLGYMFRPRTRLKQGVIAINLLVLLILSVVFFGGPRHRIAYDPFIIFLAIEVYAGALTWIWRKLRTRAQGESGGPASRGPSSPQVSSSS